MWGVLQADGMIGQVWNVPVVLVPAFQEADDGVEKEKEDEKEDENFFDAHTEDWGFHLHFRGSSKVGKWLSVSKVAVVAAGTIYRNQIWGSFLHFLCLPSKCPSGETDSYSGSLCQFKRSPQYLFI